MTDNKFHNALLQMIENIVKTNELVKVVNMKKSLTDASYVEFNSDGHSLTENSPVYSTVMNSIMENTRHPKNIRYKVILNAFKQAIDKPDNHNGTLIEINTDFIFDTPETKSNVANSDYFDQETSQSMIVYIKNNIVTIELDDSSIKHIDISKRSSEQLISETNNVRVIIEKFITNYLNKLQ